MKKLAILFLVASLSILWGYQNSSARDNFMTYEIIKISSNGLTLMDSSGNVIDVDKDPTGYKVGYNVRYDSIRNRLNEYRWQEYEVIDINDSSIKLRHETGDELSVQGNYYGKYKVGDQVRFDAVGNKIQSAKDPIQWEQYEVIETAYNKLTLKSKSGEIVILHAREFTGFLGQSFGRYKVGDLVQYDVENNKFKKGGRKTYQWKDYEVAAITDNSITLRNDQGEQLVLQGKYARRYRAGDLVKYDAINDTIKKRKKD